MIFTSELKWIAGAVTALGLIWGAHTFYNLGWDARGAQQERNVNIAIKAAVAQAQIEWQSSQSITATGMGNTNDTKQKLEVIIKQAAAIQAPLCPDIGGDYSRVYNQAVRTAKAGADTRRNVPATEMPTESVGRAANLNPNNPGATSRGVGH